MRADSALMSHLPPHSTYNRLDSQDIRQLVESVRAGYSTPANLEMYAGHWRLRITINRPTGGSVRRGFTIMDEETVAWVADYLKNAREQWKADRREHLREERKKKRLEARSAKANHAALQGR